MAGNKIFYVTRTEDESTQTAGAATKTRADKPQLLKIVGVDHAGNPSPATPEDNQIYATEEEKQEILLTSDTVQDGDLNPVTSDAVFHYAKPLFPDWSNPIKVPSYPWTATTDVWVSFHGYGVPYVSLSIDGHMVSVIDKSGANNLYSASFHGPVKAGSVISTTSPGLTKVYGML